MTETIIAQLTDDQKQCIMDLTTEWGTGGFSIIQAALLWATDLNRFPERFPPLVECKYFQDGKDASTHQYRLTELGLQIQSLLKELRHGET